MLKRVFETITKTICLISILASFSSLALAKEKLLVWEHEREEIQTVLDELIKKYQATHPDIEIKRSHYKTEDLRQQFQTAALGGGGPEIVIGPNDFAGPLSVMGTIRPINETIGDQARFIPEVVAAVTDNKKQIWGLPVSSGNHLMLFVNKSLVKKAPATLEELVTEGKKVTDAKNKKYGFAYNLNEPFWFVTFMSAFGGRPLNGNEPNLSGDPMIEALNFVHKLKFEDKIVPQDCDYTCADTLFAEGKAAMTINGDWSVQKYADALKGNLIIAPLPKSEKTGKYMQPMVSGKYIFFNKKSNAKKFALAKEFADYLAGDEAQTLFATKGGRLPALVAVAKSKAVTGNPLLLDSQKALANGQPMPMAVEMRAIWDAMRPQLQNVMAGRTASKDAATAMQSDAVQKIKQMKM